MVLTSSDILPLGKTLKTLSNKGFYDLAACAALIAKPRRALLGPSFTSCRLGERLGLRPARIGPVGPRAMTPQIAAEGCGKQQEDNGEENRFETSDDWHFSEQSPVT